MIDVRHRVTTELRFSRITLRLLVRLVLVAGAILCLLLLFRPAEAAVGTPGEVILRQDLGISGMLERIFQQGTAAFNAGNHESAVHAWRSAAEGGHAEAQFNLGIAYAKGLGTLPDMAKAAQWWRRAANQGNTDAQYNLGLIYSQGYGVAKNPAEAVIWWRMAAGGGDPAAQFNLGVMYAEGDGVAQNLKNAVRWWNKSAGQGFEHAIKALQILEMQKRAAPGSDSHE